MTNSAEIISRSDLIQWSFIRRLQLFACMALLMVLFFHSGAGAQAHLQGQWQTLSAQMPINPVHAALLNTGKVLVIAGTGNGSSGTPQWTVFDPVAQTVGTVQTLAYDMFCDGMAMMPDGRAFVVGGTLASG